MTKPKPRDFLVLIYEGGMFFRPLTPRAEEVSIRLKFHSSRWLGKLAFFLRYDVGMLITLRLEQEGYTFNDRPTPIKML